MKKALVVLTKAYTKKNSKHFFHAAFYEMLVKGRYGCSTSGMSILSSR